MAVRDFTKVDVSMSNADVMYVLSPRILNGLMVPRRTGSLQMKLVKEDVLEQLRTEIDKAVKKITPDARAPMVSYDPAEGGETGDKILINGRNYYRIVIIANSPSPIGLRHEMFIDVYEGSLDVIDGILAAIRKVAKVGPLPESELLKSLTKAIEEGHTNDVKAMVEAGANVNWYDDETDPPLITAVRHNKVEIVKLLLDRGADPTIRDSGGRGTLPVVVAVYMDNADIVKALLDKGADPNSVDLQGTCALFVAVYNHKVNSAKVLIDNGADVNCKHPRPLSSILTFATFGVHTDLMKALIEKGADVNDRGPSGGTALHIAVKMGSVEAVQILLEAGADVTIPTNDGETPLDIVNSPEIKAMLVAALPKWRGYSSSDVQVFERLFKDPETYAKEVAATKPGDPAPVPINASISICPICLSYAERADGCMYMTHVCPAVRHEELYMKFKDATTGEIEWCTACGRITSHHKHYKLSDPEDQVPGFAPTTPAGGWQFSDKYCTQAGGGGYKEKVKRFNRLLEHAAKLQTKVGILPDQEARNELVEEMWRAARGRNLTDEEIEEILKSRKFKIPESAFPAPTAPRGETKRPSVPDVRRPADEQELVPIEHKAPDNACVTELGEAHSDGRPVWQFRHKQPNGSVYDHTYVEGENIGAGGGGTRVTEYICGSDLEAAMRANTITGKCPISDRCKGWLYPEEIKGIVGDDWYELYRSKFNELKSGQKGGGVVPILRKIPDDALTCALPTKAGRRKTYRRKHKNKKTRKV